MTQAKTKVTCETCSREFVQRTQYHRRCGTCQARALKGKSIRVLHYVKSTRPARLLRHE